MSHNLKIEILLPATPEQVMHMMTDQKQIEIWSGEEAVFEAKEGGKVSLFGGWMNGEVKKLSKEELSYTWATSDWKEGTEVSLVEMKLKADGEQTTLVLQHSNLPDEDEVQSHKSGWYDFFFTPLEDYLMIRYNAE
ncbi:MAG: SRPBCC domain-containing protein [Bacteroidota bacterium]